MKNRLEELRKQRGIKQEDLANALEVSRPVSYTHLTAKLTKTVWTRLLTLCWKPSAQPERQSVLPGTTTPTNW